MIRVVLFVKAKIYYTVFLFIICLYRYEIYVSCLFKYYCNNDLLASMDTIISLYK